MPTPRRAEFERLKAECDSLRADMDLLIDELGRQRAALRIQSEQIAEMLAILDEERRSDNPLRIGQSATRQHPYKPH